MIEEVQCISARCGDEYKILLIRVSNMRPIAGLRLQTELWESENTVIDPRMTFSPLKLKGFSDIVYRLYGMFSENKIDFDKDLNVENSKQVVMNKLTDADFIQSIIKEAHDLANGISPDKRKEIDNKETIDKLKEHFK